MLSFDSKVLLANGRYKVAHRLQPGDVAVDPRGAPVRIQHVAQTKLVVPYYTVRTSNWHSPSKLLLTHEVQGAEGDWLPVPSLHHHHTRTRQLHLRLPTMQHGVAMDPSKTSLQNSSYITPSHAIGYVLGTSLVCLCHPKCRSEKAACLSLLLDDVDSREAFLRRFKAAFPKLVIAASTRSSRLELPACVTGFVRAFHASPSCTIVTNSRSPPLLKGIRDGIVHSCTSNQHAHPTKEAMEYVYLIDALLRSQAQGTTAPLTSDARRSSNPVHSFRHCSLDTTQVVRYTTAAAKVLTVGYGGDGGVDNGLVVDNLLIRSS